MAHCSQLIFTEQKSKCILVPLMLLCHPVRRLIPPNAAFRSRKPSTSYAISRRNLYGVSAGFPAILRRSTWACSARCRLAHDEQVQYNAHAMPLHCRGEFRARTALCRAPYVVEYKFSVALCARIALAWAFASSIFTLYVATLIHAKKKFVACVSMSRVTHPCCG